MSHEKAALKDSLILPTEVWIKSNDPDAYYYLGEPEVGPIAGLKRINLKDLPGQQNEAVGHTGHKEPVHDWFELSYAQYLTIPRSVLQSMPVEWQRRFVKCLEELEETIDWRPKEGVYRCQLYTQVEEWQEDGGEVNGEPTGRFVTIWGHPLEDPLMDYQRGRRQIEYRKTF